MSALSTPASATNQRADQPAAEAAAEPTGHCPIAAFAAVSVAMLVAGGWLTSLGIGPWYDELRLPPFQPPAWVFTPVWTAVLGMLAVAAARVARARRPESWVAFSLYGAQCVLNAGWSTLFFTVQRPDAALVELILMTVVVAAMAVSFCRIDRVAGWLVAPYVAWLLFAGAINGWIVWANPMPVG